MSGHSKWSKIKRKKGKRDKRRGKLFSKLSKAIAVAAREGGSGDPEQNIPLRFAIDQAKEADMPKDNIERAIARGLGEGDEGKLEEMVLEAYGPGGVALVIRSVSDNRNRTVSEIANLLESNGGSMAEPGSVLYQFERKGCVKFEGELSEDGFLEIIDCGADDVDSVGQGSSEVICPPGKVSKVVDCLEEMGKEKVEAKLKYLAKTPQAFEKKEERIGEIIKDLEDRDDVQEVFTNVV